MRRLAACAAALLAAALVIGCSKKDTPAAGEAKGEDRQALLVKGQYLTAAGDCYACHTVRGGEPYSGGFEMATPFGSIYSTNITPDKETGIGSWSADDFWRAMHEGKRKDGAYLYPAMPYTNYTKVRREDSDAIYAYLMSIKPVQQKNKPLALGFPYNQRELMLGWRTLYFTPGVFKDDPNQSAEWNRGAYLVEGLGHCNACHAARNMLGAVSADDDYSGGLIPVQNWYAPSLTSSREAGLGDWEMGDIIELLRTGISPRGAAVGPMAAVVQHSLQELSKTDLQAMAVYLKSQSDRPQSAPLLHSGPPEALTKKMMEIGSKVYVEKCQSCHGTNGEGVARVYPALANNQAVRLGNPVNAIRLVLNGGFPPATEGNPRPYGMPPFYQELSDEQVAAVVTYIRQSWGNKAPPTWPVDVSRSRGVPVD